MPESKGLYIGEYLLVVLSVRLPILPSFVPFSLYIPRQPCAFIAADYILLGRLARHLNMDQHLLVKPRFITRIFIASDVTTFLIQVPMPVTSPSCHIDSFLIR